MKGGTDSGRHAWVTGTFAAVVLAIISCTDKGGNAEIDASSTSGKQEAGRATPQDQGLHQDLIAVPEAQYSPLDGLAPGSRETQERQRKAAEDLRLPLEVRTHRTSIVLRLIPTGSWSMGSKDGYYLAPYHNRMSSEPFYCGRFEITRAQWEAVMASDPSSFKDADRDAPVETIDWKDCQTFVKKLCEMEGVTEGTYRLLTEAEWEYACKAGTQTDFCYGQTSQEMNFRGQTTVRVGSYRPNAWGLHDMHGNVAEWCQDWTRPEMDHPLQNSPGPAPGKQPVMRGGSWSDTHISGCASASRRQWASRTAASSSVGLRIARRIPSPADVPAAVVTETPNGPSSVAKPTDGSSSSASPLPHDDRSATKPAEPTTGAGESSGIEHEFGQDKPAGKSIIPGDDVPPPTEPEPQYTAEERQFIRDTENAPDLRSKPDDRWLNEEHTRVFLIGMNALLRCRYDSSLRLEDTFKEIEQEIINQYGCYDERGEFVPGTDVLRSVDAGPNWMGISSWGSALFIWDTDEDARQKWMRISSVARESVRQTVLRYWVMNTLVGRLNTDLNTRVQEVLRREQAKNSEFTEEKARALVVNGSEGEDIRRRHFRQLYGKLPRNSGTLSEVPHVVEMKDCPAGIRQQRQTDNSALVLKSMKALKTDAQRELLLIRILGICPSTFDATTDMPSYVRLFIQHYQRQPLTEAALEVWPLYARAKDAVLSQVQLPQDEIQRIRDGIGHIVGGRSDKECQMIARECGVHHPNLEEWDIMNVLMNIFEDYKNPNPLPLILHYIATPDPN
jgi:formylglycine-generating enzyme required for sulfatase activity